MSLVVSASFPTISEEPPTLYSNTITDGSGNLLSGASVQILDSGTLTPSAIYSSSDFSVILTNPFTIGADAVVTFYASPGYYVLVATATDGTEYRRAIQVGL